MPDEKDLTLLERMETPLNQAKSEKTRRRKRSQAARNHKPLLMRLESPMPKPPGNAYLSPWLMTTETDRNQESRPMRRYSESSTRSQSSLGKRKIQRQLAIAGATAKAFTPKQARHAGHSDDGSGLEDDEQDGERRKRRRVSETEMPWYQCDEFDEPNSNPARNKTVELLRISQWEHILKGEPVALDQILSSLHWVTTAEERKAHIGETDVSFGPIEASRKISTSSDWSTAWRQAARAIGFVFPHRKQELEDYAEYIENEFAAKNTAGHHRIVLDFHKFAPLYSAIVLPDGVQYSRGQKDQTRKKKEICRTCGSPSHGKSACDSTAWN